jgi:hypothetical protein
VRTTLVLPDWIASRLSALAQMHVETGAVLLAQRSPSPDGGARLLAVRLIEVPEVEYVHREAASLLIKSSGYVPALALAEQLGAIPIWTHTHPGDGSSPRPSAHDQRVDEQLADPFRLRTGSDQYGALVVAHLAGQLRFTGHLESEQGRVDIDRLLVAGERIRVAWNDYHGRPPLPGLFDRNVRAFGSEVQLALQDLRVAVVGTGGTGSAVAEQLVRLGVRNLLLVDPDHLTESNLTRVYGSTRADIGRSKVDVVRDHLLRIASDAQVRALRSMVTVEAAAREVAQVDLAFGCTDDNAGRLVLSRLAAYMLLPVIDCGVLLTSNSTGTLDGIHGRITVLHGGAACLVCRQRIDLARASSELLSPTERVRRENEGYAAALPGVEPAVVAYTTMVAATAVGELLERLIGYGPTPVPSEILLRMHDREISTNMQRPISGHYCDPTRGKVGLGLTQPFLEQTWGA